MEHLCRRFETDRLIFCWDSSKNVRKSIFPDYKKHRPKPRTSEELAFERSFRYQIYKLRTEYLPLMGYRNIFQQEGRESDDIIAAIVNGFFCLHRDWKAIIVSSDKDMLQCIRPNVDFYSPVHKDVLTYQGFIGRYGITPGQWGLMKAIAGCRTDNVPGLQGIGEKTALRYLRGELRRTTKAFQNIDENTIEIRRNKALVVLPYVGTLSPTIVKDQPNQDGWNTVTDRLGMKRIRLERRR